jgi:hypothetical protein
MEHRLKYLLMGLLLAATSIAFAAKKPAPTAPVKSNNAFDRLVDRVLAREAANDQALRSYSPLVETYLQKFHPDNEVGLIPSSDQYYLTRVGFSRKTLDDVNFQKVAKTGILARAMHGATKEFRTEFISDSFAWMMVMDYRGLDRAHYTFDYQGREFLGDLRCIVIDITPKLHSGDGRFVGRVWVEDRDFNIVRFNGTFQNNRSASYLHFDTWRLNMTPGAWLPAYVYSEDLEPAHAKSQSGNYKAQTRIWGYNVGQGHAENAFTEVLVDDSSVVKDNSDRAQDLSPVAAQRAWQRQAEDNVVERLERGGLLARTGEVDRVLDTVVNNLEITNNLDIQPEVRCRVLLTSPIESFSMGHTIFVSRGLLDVLPDEASLAAVLSHELAHIVLGHPTDTTFAFKDRSIVSDKMLLSRLHFARTQAEETEADTKALALLQNSPYHDKLQSVGLFLREVDARRNLLPHLLGAEMGNSLTTGRGDDLRMKELTTNAPRLEPKKVEQIAALPLGGRIRVDPWNNKIEISKAKSVQLLTAREKMPFEVTPVFPHLTRLALEVPAEAPKPAEVPQAAITDSAQAADAAK